MLAVGVKPRSPGTAAMSPPGPLSMTTGVPESLDSRRSPAPGIPGPRDLLCCVEVMETSSTGEPPAILLLRWFSQEHVDNPHPVEIPWCGNGDW